MSWSRNSLIAVAAVAGMGTVAADAATLVIRSSGPSAKLYPPGRSIADGAAIALKATDQLTLLDARGTRVLRGPGSFSAGGEAAAGVGANPRLAALVGGGAGDRRVRIGAVRGVAGTTRESLWSIDPSRGGTVCVADPAGLTLWRADAARDATLAIAGASAKASVAWPAGAHSIPWPETLPVMQGVEYSVSGAAPAPVTLRFATLATKPVGAQDTAAALIRNKCEGQLDRLVAASAPPAAGGGTGG